MRQAGPTNSINATVDTDLADNGTLLPPYCQIAPELAYVTEVPLLIPGASDDLTLVARPLNLVNHGWPR